MSAILEEVLEKIDQHKDNIILEEALDGKVKYIITGDKDLLELNPYKEIEILAMNDFIKEKYDI